MSNYHVSFQPGEVFHVWTHANGDENLFRVDENYYYFLDKYTQHIHPVVETYAYCLMPNHLHLMVRIKEEEDVLAFLRKKKPTLQGFETLGGLTFTRAISYQFSHLLNGYTQAYNYKYDRKGSLFIPNFNRRIVDSDNYFTALIAYIHNNPVHHGFVQDINDWPHSSWHTYLTGKSTKIKRSEGVGYFGNIDHFIEVHRELEVEKLVSVFED